MMLVVLVGMSALVIDVGALYRERRELQNGADAGALAVAQDCAEGDCLDEDATADVYSDQNASDAASSVDSVCGLGPGLSICAVPPADIPAGALGWVRVSNSTETTGGGSEVRFFFAPILDAMSGSTVESEAIAAWGPLGSATTIPLTFSLCEFEAAGGSLDGEVFPSGPTTIFFHDSGGPNEVESCAGPAGQDLPGGFGWLANSNCEATVDEQSWVGDKTGNGVPNGCDPSSWLGVEVVIPLFDLTNDLNGNNGEYHIIGFVGFTMLGYRFPGNTAGTPPPCQPPKTCIHGEFTKIATGQGEFGSGPFGATVVKMIG